MTAIAWFLAGVLCGTVHFALLWRGTRLFATTGAALPVIGYAVLRLVATTLLLGFAALHGALPLLLAAAGVLTARPLVQRMVRG